MFFSFVWLVYLSYLLFFMCFGIACQFCLFKKCVG